MIDDAMIHQTSTPVVIDVWSDLMCPWCYLGTTTLQQAAGSSDHEVEIRYHSFQLMPEFTAREAMSMTELLVQKHGVPRDRANEIHDRLAARGAQAGLTYRLDATLATNTRAAHRLIHFAQQHDVQQPMVERLFRAVFTDGLNIGDHDVLAQLAADVGLDEAEARRALDTEAFAAHVDADIRQAGQLGITGVPFFVFNNTYAISGAQPVDAFHEALRAAAEHVS